MRTETPSVQVPVDPLSQHKGKAERLASAEKPRIKETLMAPRGPVASKSRGERGSSEVCDVQQARKEQQCPLLHPQLLLWLGFAMLEELGQ